MLMTFQRQRTEGSEGAEFFIGLTHNEVIEFAEWSTPVIKMADLLEGAPEEVKRDVGSTNLDFIAVSRVGKDAPIEVANLNCGAGVVLAINVPHGATFNSVDCYQCTTENGIAYLVVLGSTTKAIKDHLASTHPSSTAAIEAAQKQIEQFGPGEAPVVEAKKRRRSYSPYPDPSNN